MPEQRTSIPEDQRWQDFANCLGKNQNIFFAESNRPSLEAVALCGNCAVQLYCLKEGFDTHERYGVRAGQTMSSSLRRGWIATKRIVEMNIAKKLAEESEPSNAELESAS